MITISSIKEQLNNHVALNHPLFDYLKITAKKGFTSTQFHIYRDNYFYRTFQTIISVANLVIAAVKNVDMKTVADAAQNLYEEAGCGLPSKTHINLLEKSHNTHGEKIFNINPVKLLNVVKSEHLIKEANRFVSQEEKLYKNRRYPIVLGAAFAHEFAATSMLTNFYESFFLPYKNRYTQEEFDQVSEYFLVHINGLEQEHAFNAEEAVRRHSETSDSLESLLGGSVKFLEAQSQLWEGLLRELIKAENIGEKVKIL